IGDMDRKILGAIVLAVAASPAWGYQVRAVYQQTSLVEADGTQTVTVEVERELNDPPSQCVLDVTASAQQFANPPFDAATPNQDYTPTSTTLNFTVGANDTVVALTFPVPVVDDSLAEV